jgi:hypothetical protein
MSRGIDDLSFEDWVYFIFDHPTERPEWYWRDGAQFWNGPAELTAAYVTRLFEEPFPALDGFGDAELNMGLNYLITPGLGEHMRCLDEPSVPVAARERCVRSCESLFRKLLLPGARLTCLIVTSRVDYPSMRSATCGGMPCRYMAAPYQRIAKPFTWRHWRR